MFYFCIFIFYLFKATCFIKTVFFPDHFGERTRPDQQLSGRSRTSSEDGSRKDPDEGPATPKPAATAAAGGGGSSGS